MVGTVMQEIRPKPTSEKPERVEMILTHMDGTVTKTGLLANDVPDVENWEDLADSHWLRNTRSKSGPLVLIRMIDDRGQPYLRPLHYVA